MTGRALDRIAGHGTGQIDRRLIEYWAHEASLIPIELHPLFRWRMADVDARPGARSRGSRATSPSWSPRRSRWSPTRGRSAHATPGAVRPPPQPGHMWNWHEGKVALEHLFFTGQVAAARRINFERLYDIDRARAPRRDPRRGRRRAAEDAQRELVRIAARALGVATEPDLGDYFRLPRAASKARVAELVAAGELLPVEVEGWTAPAYLWPDAAPPAPAPRSRAAVAVRLADLVSRRAPSGCSASATGSRSTRRPPSACTATTCCPFLLGETLVARVDLKSDRQARRAARPGRVRRGRASTAPASRSSSPPSLSWSRPGSASTGSSVARNGDLSRELAAIIG